MSEVSHKRPLECLIRGVRWQETRCCFSESRSRQLTRPSLQLSASVSCSALRRGFPVLSRFSATKGGGGSQDSVRSTFVSCWGCCPHVRPVVYPVVRGLS